jgi:NAD(P)-dependent dehydrogenase (short-subunit alcohol dehydrogenase family)
MLLENKVALITGSGRGIGRAMAKLFAAEGAAVFLTARTEKELGAVAKEIAADGGRAGFATADLTQVADCERVFGAAEKQFGRVDILVNNAATFVLKGIDASVEDWQRSVGVNIIGTSLVTKYAIEAMKKAGGGAIVNLASISSWVGQPNFITYSATKAAILQMTRCMAMDFAPYKIRVNCVCPGTILTPASYRHMEKTGMTLEQFDAEEGAKTFLKRIGKGREVATAILFLASEDASYITGTHLMVDGGYTAM